MMITLNGTGAIASGEGLAAAVVGGGTLLGVGWEVWNGESNSPVCVCVCGVCVCVCVCECGCESE